MLKMKQRLFCVLSLILLTLAISCQKNVEEEVFQTNEDQNTSTFLTKTISLKEIPEISSFLNSKSSKNIFANKQNGQEAIFDIDNIIEVIDTLENNTYSFNFSFPDTPKTTFYNLIVGKDSLGNKYPPIVLKYISNDDTYNSWAESGYNFSLFTGSIEQHKFSDYFDDSLISKGNCETQVDAVGDPIPCNIESISRGSIGGGSNNIGNQAPSNGNGSCSYSTSWRACGGDDQYTTHGPGTSATQQTCGGDGGGSYSVLTVNCPNGNNSVSLKQSVSKGDCEDCTSGPSGGIGININVAMAARIRSQVNTLGSQLGLSVAQKNFLMEPANWAMTERLDKYWRESDKSQPTKQRTQAIIEAAIEGTLIAIKPFVKYPKDKAMQYKRDYPKLTEYLKNQLPKIVEITKITNAFKKYTNMTDAQVKKTLTWGEGPALVIDQLGLSPINGSSIHGKFDENLPNELFLDIDLINDLEKSDSGSEASESLLFYIGVSILHEAVHYGDFHYNNDFWQSNINGEEGYLFEEEAYDGVVYIDRDNNFVITKKN